VALKLKVSKIVDSSSAESIKNAVHTVDPTLSVDVNLVSQTVTVESKNPNVPVASEESILQAMTAAGYPVET
jgi:copper chaperone CopZ